MSKKFIDIINRLEKENNRTKRIKNYLNLMKELKKEEPKDSSKQSKK